MDDIPDNLAIQVRPGRQTVRYVRVGAVHAALNALPRHQKVNGAEFVYEGDLIEAVHRLGPR